MLYFFWDYEALFNQSHLSTNEVMKDKQIVVLYFKLAKVFDKLTNPYSLFII